MSEFIESQTAGTFNRRIRALRAYVDLPDEYTVMADRLKAFEATGTATPCRDALVAAITAGDTDTATLAALAIAEASPHRRDVFAAVYADLHTATRAAYQPHAAAKYQEVADQFDAAAAAFIKAANVFDPEAEPAAAIEASAAEQKAWKAAAAAAAQLDRLTAPLQAAAQLAGVAGEENPAAHHGSYYYDRITTKDALLALCVDPGEIDRQTIWSAWDAAEEQATAANQAAQGFTVDVPRPRNCGRWSALREAGVTIRAADLDSYEPFGRTEPVRVTPDPADPPPPSGPKGRVYFASGRSIPVG